MEPREGFEEITKNLDTARISRRQLLGGLAAGSVAMALPLSELGHCNLAYAQGTTQSYAPKGEIDRIAYENKVKAWLATKGPLERTQWGFQIRESMTHYTYNPNSSLEDGLKSWNNYGADYESRVIRGESDLYRALNDYTAGWIPGLKVLVDAGAKATGLAGKMYQAYGEALAKRGLKEWDAQNQITAEKLQTANYLVNKDEEDRTVSRMVTMALQNPEYRQFVDLKFQVPIGTTIADMDARKIIELPPLRVNVEVAKHINPDGSLEMPVDEAQQLCEEEVFSETDGLMTDELEYLKSIDLYQQKGDEESVRKLQEERKTRIPDWELTIEGLTSSVYILSTIVGFADKKSANEIYVVGNAFIKIADSIKKFADSTEEFAGVALGFSGAVMTGNILGAVMSMVTLFQGEEEPPEKIILEGINKLQEQVSELRTEMHDRFDRIDKGLNQIYQDMQSKFMEVNARLVDLQDRVIGIQEELGDIDSELDNLTSQLGSLVQVLGQRDLQEAINGGINYREVHNGRKMTFKDFDFYQNKFYTWAVDHSVDPVEQPTSGWKFDDDEVLGQLHDKYPLGEEAARAYCSRLLYLAAWQQKLGFDPFADPNKADWLANPTTWALSCRAYSTLMQEWPSYARGLSRGHTKDVLAIGERLRDHLGKITLLEESEGSRVVNRPLFKGLDEHYRTKFEALDDALISVERSHLKDADFKTERSPKLYVDFWGDPWQKIGDDPELPQDQRIGYNPWPEPQPFPQPPNTIVSFIPAPFLLADYMRVEPTKPLSLGYRSGWAVFREEYTNEPEPRFKGYSGLPYADVIVKYGDAPILMRRIVGADTSRRLTPSDLWGEIRSGKTSVEDSRVLDEHWRYLRGLFDAGRSRELSLTPQEQAQAAQLKNTVVAQVDAALQGHRREIYKQISEQLGGALRSPVLGLSGAKALLDAFVSVGMPRALEVDDFLRAPLRGSQSILDHEQVRERYEAAARSIPVNSYVSLRSFNYPTRLVRHQNFLGELTEIQSDSDRLDATFKIVPGLADSNAISLESLNFSGHYLRQEDNRVKLLPFSDDDEFKEDATFTIVPGLADANGVSFRSYTSTIRYLRHSFFHMMVEHGTSTLFQQDATFMIEQRNPRDHIKQDTAQRATTLQQALMSHLDAIERGDYTERNLMVEAALDEARVVDAIARYTDTTKPFIEFPIPAPDSTTDTLTPTISASVSDVDSYLKYYSIRLFVDGQKVERRAFSYGWPREQLEYTPRTSLALGTHTVEIEAQDAAGNTATKQWSFKVGGQDPSAGSNENLSDTGGLSLAGPAVTLALAVFGGLAILLRRLSNDP